MTDDRSLLSTTETGRFFANTTDQVFLLQNITTEQLLGELDDLEDEYRRAIAETLSLTPRAAFEHPLVHSAIEPDHDKWESEHGNLPLFFKGTLDKNSNAYKFLFLRRSLVLRSWLQENGHWPRTTDKAGGVIFARRLKHPALHEILFDFSPQNFSDMMAGVLVNKESRVDLDDNWAMPIRADFPKIRTYLQQNQHLDAHEKLQRLLEDHLSVKSRRADGFGGDRRAALLFLMWLSKRNLILLPIHMIQRDKSAVARLLSSAFRNTTLKFLLPKERYEELISCEKYDYSRSQTAKTGRKDRRIQEVDLFTLYFGTNYCTSTTFEPTCIDLARAVSASQGKNGLRVFFYGSLDHFDIQGEERRNWEGVFSARSSAATISKDPFALFRSPTVTVSQALKVQVSNFERRSGKPYPQDGFDDGILAWVELLENTIKSVTSRKLTNEYYTSSICWITYLFTLPPEQRPSDFQDISRQLHIRDLRSADTPTFANFLKRHGYRRRGFLRPLYQLFVQWSSEHSPDIDSPIKPKIDWENDTKEYRTRRKSIPALIVETLIEENAFAATDGTPYKLFQQLKDESRSTTIKKVDGRPVDSVVPVQPAVIDCILTFGMRSSSARWLDSGQGDEFLIDVASKRRITNPSNQATADIRQGAIQLLQIGVDHEVLSMRILKSKTVNQQEIPYLPEPFALRLQAVKDLQERHNPIEHPVPAIETKAITNDENAFPIVYPLLRDPTSSKVTAVSADKVNRYWIYLLRHCEPIVHAKRQDHLGVDVPKYHFFDKLGNPIWDVHSIRVAVITALLELGVPPTIVQLLAGHGSPIMTLHYEAVDFRKTHEAIAKGFEERRLEAVRAMSLAKDENELDDAISRIMGGLVSVGESEALDLATQTLRTSPNLANSAGSFSVFSHGVCPGGTCGDGGVRKGSTHYGVHRDKACSRCRFRITGPAFLNGLILNANILMSEIGASTKKEQELNSEIRSTRGSGRAVAVLEARLNQERDFRDELWSDWAAEYQTIQKCLELLKFDENSENLPALPSKVSTQIKEEHHFSLLQHIMTESKTIAGSSMDVPSGLRESRNEVLWDIAANNGDVAKYLLGLPKAQRDSAMNEFGDLVARLERESSDDEGIIPGLLDGTKTLPSGPWDQNPARALEESKWTR
ncbi:hypothetical protein R3X27_12630 [Tropicimonas sp. TH_r6]|uniref:hypothetical protein n=1 Tax=Tropicimonas sp. TH_r6 TaxID=3082085 RepID=UPI00295406CC|nr:hypothetical protein [Tropicimonas sp. TH_r6]MDV7143526.1 hypothetical protein [Tropicimonas sp. TH_r6]